MTADEKPWEQCPSTHCDRREECASPSDCIVKSPAARVIEAARGIVGISTPWNSPAYVKYKAALAAYDASIAERA